MSWLLAWLTIVRFGIVQASIAAITVLPITTLPRLMQNEIGLAAVIAGLFIALYYGVQLSRVLVGYLTDALGRRTPFIVIGLVGLACAGVLASLSITLMERELLLGALAAAISYALIGVGVGVAGTSLLALLATTVEPDRRAPAATIVWLLMIFGIAGTATAAGAAMSPFTYAKLVEVATIVSAVAAAVGILAVLGLERRGRGVAPAPRGSFTFAAQLQAARDAWGEPATRGFAVFVFVAMFAFNMQEVVFETFLGAAFGFDAGVSTKLSGFHRYGILIGLIGAAVVGRILHGAPRAMVSLTVVGCLGSAVALVSLGASAFVGLAWPITPTIVLFGFANGLFAGGAVASMFGLANVGRERREGTRMGAFGVAQAVGFGLGMFAGATQLDLVRAVAGETIGFASVFFVEAAIFVVAAGIALRISRTPALPGATPLPA